MPKLLNLNLTLNLNRLMFETRREKIKMMSKSKIKIWIRKRSILLNTEREITASILPDWQKDSSGTAPPAVRTLADIFLTATAGWPRGRAWAARNCPVPAVFRLAPSASVRTRYLAASTCGLADLGLDPAKT